MVLVCKAFREHIMLFFKDIITINNSQKFLIGKFIYLFLSMEHVF